MKTEGSMSEQATLHFVLQHRLSRFYPFFISTSASFPIDNTRIPPKAENAVAAFGQFNPKRKADSRPMEHLRTIAFDCVEQWFYSATLREALYL